MFHKIDMDFGFVGSTLKGNPKLKKSNQQSCINFAYPLVGFEMCIYDNHMVSKLILLIGWCIAA